MPKELSYQEAMQDARDLDKIELLNRMVDRKALDEESARVIDEVEKRMENGQPVPPEELDLFCKIVWENSEAKGDEGGRFQILREKIEAYNKEQLSLQDERISTAESRTDFSKMEKEIMSQLDMAVKSGDDKQIQQCQQRLEQIQSMRDNLKEPQEVEKAPEISDEQRAEEYEKINEYANKLHKELGEWNQTHQVVPFGMDDIKKATSNVKTSDINKQYEKIKLEKAKEKQDIERG